MKSVFLFCFGYFATCNSSWKTWNILILITSTVCSKPTCGQHVFIVHSFNRRQWAKLVRSGSEAQNSLFGDRAAREPPVRTRTRLGAVCGAWALWAAQQPRALGYVSLRRGLRARRTARPRLPPPLRQPTYAPFTPRTLTVLFQRFKFCFVKFC